MRNLTLALTAIALFIGPVACVAYEAAPLHWSQQLRMLLDKAADADARGRCRVVCDV